MGRWSNAVYLKLTTKQREYLLGAVLGDDALLRNTVSSNVHLRAQQSLAHREYLMWKYRIMENQTLTAPRVIQNNRYDKVHWGVRFHTRATPELTALYQLCYPNGKKTVSQSWLDQLTEFSLAVWYMDDGTYAPKRDFCMLYTGAFPYSQQLLIKQYLRNRWNVTGFAIQQNRQQWCVRFTRHGTQKFLSIVERYIELIPSMEYKLGGSERPWRRPINPLMDPHKNAWRKDEDRILEKYYGHIPARDLAQRLGRTLNAVLLRGNKLSLNGWQADRVSDEEATYTAN